jgi:hypothetical protein
MQHHYSTVTSAEIRARIGNVVSLVCACAKPAIEPSGVHDPEMQKTGSG